MWLSHYRNILVGEEIDLRVTLIPGVDNLVWIPPHTLDAVSYLERGSQETEQKQGREKSQ